MKRIPGGRNTPGASPCAASRRLVPLLALLISLALPALAQASGPSVSAYDSLATLRPEQPAPAGGSPQASISAARNETESFQLLIGAGSANLTGLRVDPAEVLTGPGGATIPAEDLTIYREGTYNVTQRSDAEGATGLWPDVLIPERDPLYNEARTAFPVNLSAGSQLGVWVDVLVPQGQAPGAYRGSLAVSDSAGTSQRSPSASASPTSPCPRLRPSRAPSTSTRARSAPPSPATPTATATSSSLGSWIPSLPSSGSTTG